MNKKTIELFLQRNPIDNDFVYGISEKTIHIWRWEKRNFDITINLNSIKLIGLSSDYVFIETDFGKYSFLKKSVKENLIKGDE